MSLTTEQRQRVERYLRAVITHLGDETAEMQRRALERLRERIESELRQLDQKPLDDGDIDMVLRNCGTPSGQAQRLRSQLARKPKPVQRGVSLDTSDPRWLGVCAGLARYLGYEPLAIRLVVFILGLGTGPFAVIAYLAAYFVLYFSIEEQADVPKIAWKRLAYATSTVLAGVGCLHVLAMFLLHFALRLYVKYTGATLIALGPWTWLERDAASLFWTTLLFAMPFAVLGGLPAANGWPKTAHKVAQAIVAIYAVVLCFGLGSALAGIILQTGNTFAVGVPSIG